MPDLPHKIAADAPAGRYAFLSRQIFRLALALVLLALSPPALRAQELYLLGGLLQNANDGKDSYAWQLEYIEGLGENFGLGVSYLNEGHVPGHHRDGNTLHLWARTNLLDRKLSLAAGIGPYYFYDTLPAKAGTSYQNDHGWGMIFSSAATWYTDSRWLLQLRANVVENFATFNSFSVLAGIGYQLEAPAVPGPVDKAPLQDREKTKNEFTLLLGQTIVNSLESQKSVALAVEYRRRVRRYVDWSASWLYEGDNRLFRRHGVASQLWAIREFFDDRFTVGIGGGAYFPLSMRAASRHFGVDRSVCGIVTLTSSYRFLPRWDARVSWNRIITSYNHDTDVILGGIGYRF
ncbi:hypothetical protein [Geobacter sp. AOG2]|uniref:hypothetical protein n=1 Tax=Geobacter sp. AOG2 TaxID=1566347 RepID=UPI001CC62EEC|nr:hypothetical protein [Geobacter sp. AOG2]GFE59512.1 hypothetical protein AOG2_01000 [Geobacter sp. AOG2]